MLDKVVVDVNGDDMLVAAADVPRKDTELDSDSDDVEVVHVPPAPRAKRSVECIAVSSDDDSDGPEVQLEDLGKLEDRIFAKKLPRARPDVNVPRSSGSSASVKAAEPRRAATLLPLGADYAAKLMCQSPWITIWCIAWRRRPRLVALHPCPATTGK